MRKGEIMLTKPINERSFFLPNCFKLMVIGGNKLTGKFDSSSNPNTIRKRHFVRHLQTGSFLKNLCGNRIYNFYGIMVQQSSPYISWPTSGMTEYQSSSGGLGISFNPDLPPTDDITIEIEYVLKSTLMGSPAMLAPNLQIMTPGDGTSAD